MSCDNGCTCTVDVCLNIVDVCITEDAKISFKAILSELCDDNGNGDDDDDDDQGDDDD